MVSRILVTGASGFLGRHLLPVLESEYPRESVIGVSSSDADLMDRSAVDRLLEAMKPTAVVHLAAYSGGIGANRKYPANFYYRNTLLTAHMFDAAAQAGVFKLIYTMGGCSYPANAPSPISERQLWQGFPQRESAGYSTAKMMGTVASAAYRVQYGLNSVVLIPGNMYGEWDNFRNDESHVVPAMIRRYWEARRNRLSEVVMWGTGRPERDFVYAGDVAACMPFFINGYDSSEPVNVSTGTRVSIQTLAETIADIVGFDGRIVWDSTKPDGQMIKIFDTTRLTSLGLGCGTALRDGLRKTIDWFATHYDSQSDGLRV